MTKTKENEKAPKKAQKTRTEKEVIKGKTFYKIYKADKLVEMLTEQEFEIRNK